MRGKPGVLPQLPRPASPGWRVSKPRRLAGPSHLLEVVGTGCPSAPLLLPTPHLQTPQPRPSARACFSRGLVARICVPWPTRGSSPFLLLNPQSPLGLASPPSYLHLPIFNAPRHPPPARCLPTFPTQHSAPSFAHPPLPQPPFPGPSPSFPPDRGD